MYNYKLKVMPVYKFKIFGIRNILRPMIIGTCLLITTHKSYAKFVVFECRPTWITVYVLFNYFFILIRRKKEDFNFLFLKINITTVNNVSSFFIKHILNFLSPW